MLVVLLGNFSSWLGFFSGFVGVFLWILVALMFCSGFNQSFSCFCKSPSFSLTF